jgi:exosome complex component RRP43
MVVCSRTEKRQLNVRGLPVACTAAVFEEKELGEVGTGVAEGRHWLLLDPDRLEETLCREAITMVVDCSDGETRIKSIEKQGGTAIGRELIRGFAVIAEKRWKEVQGAMK